MGKQSSARILAKQGSQQVYIIIHKSKKWLVVNYNVNAIGVYMLNFIFKGKNMQDDYIKMCK
jgi:hypothetical protein